MRRPVESALGFLNTFLLVFALIVVFVSAFLMFNTFSMLVAQRTRELALLRAIGASRDQVQTGVIFESAILGVVPSTIGVILGIGLAFALRWLFNAIGIELPGGSLDVAPRTVIMAYFVGVLVTVASAYILARRASSVPPIAAMRSDVSPTRASMLRRTIFGVVCWVLTTLMVWAGLANGSSTGIAIVGLAAFLGSVGTIALSPYLTRRFISALGWPFRGTTDRLAVLNSKRDPRRTAATASALTIGVTLMTAMVIFSQSFTDTANSAIEDAYGADFTLGIPPTYSQPYDHELFSKIEEVSGVGVATFARNSIGQRSKGSGQGDEPLLVFGIQPDKMDQMVTFDVTEDTIGGFKDGEAAVDSKTAKEFGWKVGSEAKATFRTGEKSLTIVGVYEPVLVFSGFQTNMATAEDLGATPGQENVVYLKLAEGADANTVRGEIEEVLKDYPQVEIQDQAQIKEDINSQINQLLGLVFALLGLAILITVLGIVNTLLLSVVERTRELGLLRAIGSLRSQVRSMIVIESLLLGHFGAAVGVLLGVIFGVVLQKAMVTEGLTEVPQRMWTSG